MALADVPLSLSPPLPTVPPTTCVSQLRRRPRCRRPPALLRRRQPPPPTCAAQQPPTHLAHRGPQLDHLLPEETRNSASPRATPSSSRACWGAVDRRNRSHLLPLAPLLSSPIRSKELGCPAGVVVRRSPPLEVRCSPPPPPLDCLLCSLGVVVHRSLPLDGWRSSAPKYRPCSGACTPPALPHPTLRHHLPHPELGFTTPTAFQFELRLDLIPAAAVFLELRKPSSDTLSSATCFSNHWYVTVVRSGRWLLQSWRRRSGGSIPAASGEHTTSTSSKQSRPMMQQRWP
ncbi:hypothetical protein VPH35_056165 [Triticum aestivum]|uniref:protein EARLY FLOWERING 5 n=1 Tax=Triticum aestivum TaxID=4565 RepID=UPI001D025813|nr:protein EARLY FLOWERING 5-like [Triticum aestivum]